MHNYIKNQYNMFLAIFFFAVIAFILGMTAGAHIERAKNKNVVITETVTEKTEDIAEDIYILEKNVKSLGVFELTAYCPCEKCCGKSDGITASGTKATAGRTIAADTNIIPFGTKLIINNHEYIVEDRGGTVKGNKIDVFFNTHSEALQFGRQKAEIFVSE